MRTGPAADGDLIGDALVAKPEIEMAGRLVERRIDDRVLDDNLAQGSALPDEFLFVKDLFLRGHEKAGSVVRTISALSALAPPVRINCTRAGFGLPIKRIIVSPAPRNSINFKFPKLGNFSVR